MTLVKSFGIFFLILFYVVNQSIGFYEKCDQIYNIEPGDDVLTIKSTDHGNNWNETERAYSCRYLIKTLPNYQISLTCNLYMTCLQEKEFVFISRDGLKNLDDNEKFCGTKIISSNSLFNSIVFGKLNKFKRIITYN